VLPLTCIIAWDGWQIGVLALISQPHAPNAAWRIKMAKTMVVARTFTN